MDGHPPMGVRLDSLYLSGVHYTINYGSSLPHFPVSSTSGVLVSTGKVLALHRTSTTPTGQGWLSGEFEGNLTDTNVTYRGTTSLHLRLGLTTNGSGSVVAGSLRLSVVGCGSGHVVSRGGIASYESLSNLGGPAVGVAVLRVGTDGCSPSSCGPAEELVVRIAK